MQVFLGWEIYHHHLQPHILEMRPRNFFQAENIKAVFSFGPETPWNSLLPFKGVASLVNSQNSDVLVESLKGNKLTLIRSQKKHPWQRFAQKDEGL